MKKTEELLKTIQSCKNYQDFISESRQELISVRKLGEAFQEILTQKKLKKSAPKGLTNGGKCCTIMFVALINATRTNGSIAQLGEHLPYKQRVTGSSPVVPTIWPSSSVG